MKTLTAAIFLSLFIFNSAYSGNINRADMNIGEPLSKPQKKSIPKAMMYSIMIPGWGDFYAGNRTTGKVLIATETAIWLSFFGFEYYGNIQKKDYMLFAHENADANLSRKEEDYYDAMEVYKTSEDYNTNIREQARDLYPDNPEMQKKYVEENGYFGADSWEWSKDNQFINYRKMRVSTRETFQRAMFMTGFAILNRFAAAITSARNVHTYNKKIDELQWGIQLYPNRINIVYRF